MGSCYYCGKEVDLPFWCSYCNVSFCAEHRIPENHNCTRLPERKWGNIPIKSYRADLSPKRVEKIKAQPIRKNSNKAPSHIEPKILGESMGDWECSHCGISEGYMYRCWVCDQIFCGEHRQPTKHGCPDKPRPKDHIQSEVESSRSIFRIMVFLFIISIPLLLHFSNPEAVASLESTINDIFTSIGGLTTTISESLENLTLPNTELITSVDTQEIEQLILKNTNIERKNRGLKELIWDEKLATIAREHSEDMANNDFFGHVNLKGEDPDDRARRHGYPLRKDLGEGRYMLGIAENIGKMPTGNVLGVGYVNEDSQSIAKAQVDSLMDSPGHRENILNPLYDKIGVGVAYDGKTYYITTQNFQ